MDAERLAERKRMAMSIRHSNENIKVLPLIGDEVSCQLTNKGTKFLNLQTKFVILLLAWYCVLLPRVELYLLQTNPKKSFKPLWSISDLFLLVQFGTSDDKLDLIILVAPHLSSLLAFSLAFL
jgi:hypothetical protein